MKPGFVRTASPTRRGLSTAAPVKLTAEREIRAPVDLCTAAGDLNPAAVGWTRQPLHTANLSGAWGRNKRWVYWNVLTPDATLGLVVSDIDYLALHSVYWSDLKSTEIDETAIVPLGRVDLPATSGGGAVRVDRRDLQIAITPSPTGVRLQAATKRVRADITVARPPGHECLGVVIPWSTTRFQYTVKENGLPATGSIAVDGREYALPTGKSWGVLDFGSGRWPYETTWNWAAGSGVAGDGTRVGLQFGGKWTDGTGMTENAVCIDGRLHKLGTDLSWEYDALDWMKPWRIADPAGGRVELAFTPQYERKARTNVLVIATEVHQCFGTWSGWVTDDAGRRVCVDGVRGFAEEARSRW